MKPEFNQEKTITLIKPKGVDNQSTNKVIQKLLISLKPNPFSPIITQPKARYQMKVNQRQRNTNDIKP